MVQRRKRSAPAAGKGPAATGPSETAEPSGTAGPSETAGPAGLAEPSGRSEPSLELAEATVGWVIARRVRECRTELGLTVEQLADRSGISKGMLSKIENAQASPSLGTLVKLAAATSVPLTSFFRGLEEEHGAVLVKAGQGIDIVRKGTRAGHHYQSLGGVRGAQRIMEPLLVTLTDSHEVFPLFQHSGVELLYALEGVVEYGFGADRYELHPGDALQFDGGVPHGPTRLARTPVRFLSVIAHDTSATSGRPVH